MISRIASVIALCVLLSDAVNTFSVEGPRISWNERTGKRIKIKRSDDFLSRPIGFDDDDSDVRPILVQAQTLQSLSPALQARYVVNHADWASVATISTRKDVPSFPAANLVSIADGPVGNGTGIPYMYLTPLDYTAKDLAKDHRASLLVSLAQGNYCKQNDYDPMDPRCVRVMLTGKIVALKNNTQEYDFAKKSFFGRHPKLEGMPPSHNFFFAEFRISVIAMLYTFGGPKYIPVEDYLNPSVAPVKASLVFVPFTPAG